MAVALLMMVAAMAGAQETPAPENAPAVPTADIVRLEGKLTPVGPDTFILLDNQGNPQRVLNMGIEEFLAAWREKQTGGAVASPAEADRWTLNNAEYKGKIEGNHVALQAAFTITLHEAGEVEVPLGLSGAVLAKLPEAPQRADGRFLRFDNTLGGYLVTLSGAAGDSREVKLDLVVPLQRDGTRVSLRLLAPRAIRSNLQLDSPSAIQSAMASEGVVLSTRNHDSGNVEIDAEGVAGETTVSWVDRPVATDTPEATLTSSAKLLMTMSGREIQTKARITVESYGQAFREFDIELPPGAEYQQTGFTQPIKSIKQLPATGESNRGIELRVTLVADTSDPVSVDLETKQTLPIAENGSSQCTLQGFSVSGAVPQEGEVVLVVDDDWQLRFEPTDGVRLVRPAEADLAWLVAPPEPERIAAALRFVRQPWQLPVAIVPRQLQIIATPDYELTINPGEALLRMEVTYHIEGGRTPPMFFAQKFALAGWDQVSTTMVGIEDAQQFEETVRSAFADPMAPTESEEHIYGFNTGYATSRDPRVTIQLRHVWQPEENERFALPLPYPLIDPIDLNPSQLVVKTDTSLQIKPDVARMAGLTPLPIVDEQDASRGEAVGQQFYYRGNYPQLEFAASRQLRPQRMLLDCNTEINMEADSVSVVQDLLLEVRHQPASTLLLATPREVEGLQVELLPAETADKATSGTVLEVTTRTEAVAGSTVPERQVTLPHPRLGTMRLRAKYKLPRPTTTGDSFVLSLISLPEAEFGTHRLELSSSLGQALVPAPNSPWRIESSPTGDGGLSKDLLITNKPTPFLALATAGRTTNGGVVEIQRIWVQSWLTPRITQLRTAFRFRSSADRLRVELPDNAPDGDQVEVVLDGTPLVDEVQGDSGIELSLPADDSREYHTLEIRYRLPANLSLTTPVDIDRPRLAGDDQRADVFWQVVAPVEYQPVWHAPALVEAFRPAWQGSDWRTESDWGTAELADWIGASHGLQPTSGEHVMVYQAWEDSSLEIVLVRRELLVLAIATLAVAASIALWYVPWLRRPPVLLVCLVVLAGIGLAYPQQISTLTRFGVFGAGCGLLAWLIVLMYPRHNVPGSTITHSPSARADRSGSHGPTMVLPSAGHVSTNAPTVAVEVNESHG